ncbi:MAG TPA: hypothetical protein VFA33_03255 [Bryobacteraceae bacterium]|nr:hypothetical protein [Bryobacteraceae bacterium]
MSGRGWFMGLLVAIAASGAQSEKVRNERVAVVEVTLRPGEAASVAGDYPSVTVYFTSGIVAAAAGGGTPQSETVRRGEAVFRAAQARVERNSGASVLHFARVEFLGSGGAETWGSSGLSPHYQVLLENQYTRVYDIRIPAHTAEPRHTHKDRVVICLSGAQLRHLMPDGRQEDSTLKTGEIAWRRGSTHIGQNLGNTDLWVIAVEPK